MGPQILIVPDDLDTAARALRGGAQAMAVVAARLGPGRPEMPASLAARVEDGIEQLTRDVGEQRAYMGDEADALALRANLARKADNPDSLAALMLVFDLLGLGSVAGLTPEFDRDPRPDLDDVLADYQQPADGMTMWPVPVFGQRITQREAELLGLPGPDDVRLDATRNRAFDESSERYGGTTARDTNDGHEDAFRHAYWNALMARSRGQDFARDFGTAHEGVPGNPPDREAMDLYNNEVGRRIQADNPDADDEQLAGLVEAAVRRGELVVIDENGELQWSDRVPLGQHGQADDPPTEDGGDGDSGDTDSVPTSSGTS